MSLALPGSLAHDPRARRRNDRPVDPHGRCVLLWIQRAQRAIDNPAMDAAIGAANALSLPVVAFHGLTAKFPRANERHYAFLLDGIPDIAAGCEARGVAFCFRPAPEKSLVRFAREVGAALVVGDENPLRETEQWRRSAAEKLPMALVTIDADVIVPSSCFPREEYAARTLRPKLHERVDEFLIAGKEPRARVVFPPGARPSGRSVDAASWPAEKARLLAALPIDRSAKPVTGEKGGTGAGLRALDEFVARRLRTYDEQRNRPENPRGTSLLSAYLHFGHLGPRQVALAVKNARSPEEPRAAYIEELVVRRELAWNFVLRNPRYDAYAGFPEWARKSLEAHLADPREHLYDEATLEAGRTHDPLWNAAQREMVATGRTHGYARMYWAKKLLEWSAHPARAQEIAIRFNDRYFLDGRDPNGYTNIAWAIGGKHDRPWAPARPIFGMVRYMSFASTSRKFDWKAYAARVEAACAGG